MQEQTQAQAAIQAAMKFTDADLSFNRDMKLSTRQRMPFLVRFIICCGLMIGVLSLLSLILFSPNLFDWYGQYARNLKPFSRERNYAIEVGFWSLIAICLIVLTRQQYQNLVGEVVKLRGAIQLRHSKWYARAGNPLGCVLVIKERTFPIDPKVFDLLEDHQSYTIYCLPKTRKLLSVEVKT